MGYLEEYKKWCTDAYFDSDTKAELKEIEHDEKEIEDRFYRQLEFGTGGLRGVIGAGTNRMNIYTVRQATQGLANYIVSQNGQRKGVAIAYDSRRMSPEFAREAALCLNGNGIKTYIFESLRPTPELSFAVRELGCISGIVVTASHNPREYNGYKVYWEDGAQITSPHDKNILAEVAKVTDLSRVKTMDSKTAEDAGLYHVIDASLDDRYMEELKKQSIHPEIIKAVAKDIKIVYTPLHGSGNVPVRRVLKELGFENVYVVKEQELPDGNFPTVAYPNPESPKAFELALALAKEVDADIVLATDPDADRLGVYAKNAKTGEYVSFTGNMSGMLIAEYILRERKAAGALPVHAALVETIVTTDMAKAIAKKYGVKLIEVLTGFKFIGEQIKYFEEENTYEYVFGLEESYGCLAGTYARDKDACVAVMMLCEVASWCKANHKTLWDEMLAMYESYGYYKEGLETMTLKGIDGAEQIISMMADMRKNPPKKLGSYQVLAVRDYKADTRTDLLTGDITATGLPSSNVLYYELENHAWCCVRPSGTEPKIKFYFGAVGDSLENAGTRLDELNDAMMSYAKGGGILFLEPVFTENIWGGTVLRDTYGYEVSGDHIGECWGIAAHDNGDCTIKNGPCAGMKLSKLWEEKPEMFGGSTKDRFPLLIKIIDARENLSIQVHPDDAYAMEHENGSFGKTECWYILGCSEDASLIVGHNAKTKEELEEMIHQGRWTEFIREVPVKKGDFIQIDPGTVHAIKGGIQILETQQNSDITYRVYDFDRLSDGKPRELHINQSIDVITVPAKAMDDSIKHMADLPANTLNEMISCEFYRVFKLNVEGTMEFEQKFPYLIVSVIEGRGTINGIPVKKGDHMIIPSGISEVEMTGRMELVASTAE